MSKSEFRNFARVKSKKSEDYPAIDVTVSKVRVKKTTLKPIVTQNKTFSIPRRWV